MPTPTNLRPASMPQTRWAEYDRQSVVMEHPETNAEVVMHGQSAVANVKQIGRNVADAFMPNHIMDLTRPTGGYMGDAFNVLLMPWAIAGEVVDVVALPVKVAKNAADAIAHGAVAAADKLVFWK